MTRITVVRNQSGDVLGFTASGHAGDASAGSDIFCAAVSAITQTACIGLTEVAKKKVKLTVRDGYLSAFLAEKDAADPQARTIFSTMLLGLASFDEGNPGHILIFEEVR